jgi:DNA primase
LFIPRDLRFDNRQLLICEGPTDTAACLDLGFDAIGRPSCLGAVKLTAAFISEQWPLDVVIVSDSDIAGRNGASKLAGALAGVSRTVRIIEPPIGVKDIREWKRQGATYDDILNLIQQSKPINITITGEISE